MEYGFFRERCGKCMYGSGEGGCSMTQERYRELYDNDTLGNLPCRGRGISPEIAAPQYGTGKEAATGAEVVVTGFADYRQYKAELDREMKRAAQSFVKIGFLLRVAEDTDILKESGYRNVTEFAAAEYGLEKSQVSRFININIRFSEGGYSDHLQERYEKFGYAKLAIMLLLPEEVNAELPDSLSKADIQAVAEEVKAEAAISDIELAIERAEVAPVQPEGQEAGLCRQAAARLCREQQELFGRLWYGKDSLECMQEILAPAGENVFMVRIPGTGRLMVTVWDRETSVTVVRTGDKEKCSTEEFVTEIWKICNKGLTPEEAFRKEFGEEMEKPAADPSGETLRPAAAGGKKEPRQRKTPKVTKARTPGATSTEETPAAAVKEPEDPAGEEQLPGQMEVYDYPEMIPEEMKEESHGTEEREAAGGEKPATDGGMGSCAGADDGGQEPGLRENDEVPETAEDDGCAEDHGIAGMTEESAWEGAKTALYALRVRFEKNRGMEETVDLGEIRTMYGHSIDLAVALEKIMKIRSRKNE